MVIKMFRKEDFISDLGKQMQIDSPYLFYDEEQKKVKTKAKNITKVRTIHHRINENTHETLNSNVSQERNDYRGNNESQNNNNNNNNNGLNNTNNNLRNNVVNQSNNKKNKDGMESNQLEDILKGLSNKRKDSIAPNNITNNNLDNTNTINNNSTIDSKITPYTIVEHLRNNSVVGEEANSCLITIALSNRMHTILEGYSGSGKNFVMDKILKLFDGKYELQLTSGQAVWYHTDEINNSSILYLPELQKAIADKGNKVSGVIELMKALGEGKDAKRVVTNKDRTGIDTQIIKAGKTIASTIAHENNFKYDRELQRRFLILETDNSPEHISKIIEDKIHRKMRVDVSGKKEHIQKQLSDRINYVRELNDIKILNPFIEYMQDTFPVINKTQSYMDHYLELFESWGKFFSPEREKVTIDNITCVMLNIEDVYNVFEMYNPHFMRVMKSFNENNDIPLFKPDWTECMKQGLYNAENNLKVLTNSGEINIGKEYVSMIERWKNNQLYDSKVFIQDYKTGNNIEILDLSKNTYNFNQDQIKDNNSVIINQSGNVDDSVNNSLDNNINDDVNCKINCNNDINNQTINSSNIINNTITDTRRMLPEYKPIM
jgi:hypothetical protein